MLNVSSIGQGRAVQDPRYALEASEGVYRDCAGPMELSPEQRYPSALQGTPPNPFGTLLRAKGSR